MDEIKPIRVAQIMGKLWAGGVEAVVFNYYREVDKSKVQFDFFYDDDSTVEPPQDIVDMGARFYKIPKYQNVLKYLKTLDKYFKDANYKIVHSHINSLSVLPLFVAWKRRIPIRIAHNHSVPGGTERWKNVLKNILKLFSKLFATKYCSCSDKAGRWLFGNKLFDKGMVTVINNAVNESFYQISEEEKTRIKKEFGLTNKFILGHIGRLTYAKNHFFMIDLLKEVVKIKENTVLFLVGDGEMKNDICKYINDNNLDDKVIMIGQVENPQKFYSLVDVMLVPSFFEGLSLTTIESQIARVPVVASKAIPEEAIISDSCYRLELSDSIQTWIDTIIMCEKKEVSLNKNGNNYNIHKKARELTKMYEKWLEEL